MQVTRIADGLWRWTGRHPDWKPGEGWDHEVGCVYVEAPAAIVLIDPLIPPEDRDRFLEALDRDVDRVGRPVRIALTTVSHRRSADELAARYGGELAEPGTAPPGIEPLDTGWGGEVLLWLPAHRTLVAGDVLLGDGEGGVRLPSEWLRDDEPAVRAKLTSLLELPVERVLPAHGDPVLAGGREALARALGHAPSAA